MWAIAYDDMGDYGVNLDAVSALRVTKNEGEDRPYVLSAFTLASDGSGFRVPLTTGFKEYMDAWGVMHEMLSKLKAESFGRKGVKEDVDKSI